MNTDKIFDFTPGVDLMPSSETPPLVSAMATYHGGHPSIKRPLTQLVFVSDPEENVVAQVSGNRKEGVYGGFEISSVSLLDPLVAQLIVRKLLGPRMAALSQRLQDKSAEGFLLSDYFVENEVPSLDNAPNFSLVASAIIDKDGLFGRVYKLYLNTERMVYVEYTCDLKGTGTLFKYQHGCFNERVRPVPLGYAASWFGMLFGFQHLPIWDASSPPKSTEKVNCH